MKLIDYSRMLLGRHANANELREEYYRRCYELYDSVNGIGRELIRISHEEGIHVDTIRNHAKEYYEENIEKIEGKTWNEKYIDSKFKNFRGSPRNFFFLKLMEEERPEASWLKKVV